MSSFATLVQIFTEPGKAMEAVRERSMILLPLFLLLAANAGLLLWYYQVVDFPWLVDHLIAASPEMDAAQREQFRGFMSRSFMTGSAVIGMLVVMPIVLLIMAVYYLLAAKVIGNENGFGKWFAFAVWTAVPTLVLVPAGALQILMASNGQLAPEALNPLTLNYLFFGLPASSPWAGLLNTLSLAQFWSFFVAIVGMQRWTGKSAATSSVIVLLPQVLIFGGWAIIAAMKAAA